MPHFGSLYIINCQFQTVIIDKNLNFPYEPGVEYVHRILKIIKIKKKHCCKYGHGLGIYM